jgi:DNA-binding response OmpR family regulator
MPVRIIVVSHELRNPSPLVALLRRDGHDVIVLNTLAEARSLISNEHIDLVVASESGLSCSCSINDIAQYDPYGRLIVVASSDSLSKSISVLNLDRNTMIAAQVFHQLRKLAPERLAAQLSGCNVVLDRTSRRVFRSRKAVKLDPVEYAILEILMERKGGVVSREEIVRRLRRGDRVMKLRSVDIHIALLRKALKKPNKATPIETVRGRGYRLRT